MADRPFGYGLVRRPALWDNARQVSPEDGAAVKRRHALRRSALEEQAETVADPPAVRYVVTVDLWRYGPIVRVSGSGGSRLCR